MWHPLDMAMPRVNRSIAVAASILVLSLSACSGDDPKGPPPVQTVEATVIVDWPLAREPGFVDASFTIREFTFDTTTFATGTIPPSGVAEARFLAECGPSRPQVFVISLVGHFSFYEDDPVVPEEGPLCRMGDSITFLDCENPTYTTDPQDWSAPQWQCEPPAP